MRTAVVIASLLAVAQPAAASDIAEAARRQDTAEVRRLLAAKADVNAPLGDGMTALHWAAYNDDAALVTLLLAAGANAEAVTRNAALTPLLVAATHGHAGVVEVLLKAGANAEARSSDQATALMLAAAAGDTASIESLLRHGAAANAADGARGQTPLMFAAAAGRASAIQQLLRGGADPGRLSTVVKLAGSDLPARRAQPTNGVSDAILTARQQRRVRPAAMGGLSALHFAARNGHLDAVRALAEGGANVDQASGSDQATPMVIAISSGHFDVARYLLDHGANPNLVTDAGLAALYAVIEAQYPPTSWSPTRRTEQERTTHLALMRALLERGADPNARLTRKLWFRPSDHDDAWIGTAGTTPFWRAAFANDVPAMRLLLEHGADPNIASVEGSTPLMVAAGLGWLPMIRAVPESRLAAVELCLELGNDLNAADVFKYTALHGAAYRGDNDLVAALIAKGARVDVKTVFGSSVTDMANGFVAYSSLPRVHHATVELLVSRGAPPPSPPRPGEFAYCNAAALNCPEVREPH
jgi:ankyrin repeat protein